MGFILLLPLRKIPIKVFWIEVFRRLNNLLVWVYRSKCGIFSSIVNVLGEFVNKEKIGHRYVIQYFHWKGLSLTNINVEIDSNLGESAPLFTTIRYWVAEFKSGHTHTSCQDEHRSCRPNEVTMTEMVKKIDKMVLDKRR